MAGNTVNIDLQIASKGMDPAVQKSQTIRDNLTAAGTAMTRGGATQAGTAGSRAAVEKSDSQTYAAQRGVAGGTGAAARNFAAESQGLGGLVRLYATFAANTFAAAAAFTALSTAMNTSNMVKGLDQLGAASGVNLGTLSKQLVSVTGGAISLQESMRAVAQATSAGMGSENILKLGKVAEKASQALGISMSDAVSRLSRGITKLEPELLDELGIFTKIDESSQKYAASLGKSAGALTDFEKRQGFANAVLEEGINKFGKIKIETNPYSQLTASLQNLAQSGLELVNTVLGPLVKLLASSPTALTAVVAGLAGMLIKQAIPAIGQYREALQVASEKALLAVSGSTTASKAALTQKIAQTRNDAELLAEVEVEARDAATKKLQALQGGSFAKSRARLTPILDKPVQDVTTKELAYLEAQAAKNLTRNAALAASYREVADTIIAGQAAESRFAAIRAREVLAEQELANVSKARQLADVEYRKLSEAAIVRDINLKTASAVKELGYIQALKLAYLEYGKARASTTQLEVPTGRSTRGTDGSKIPELEKVSVPAITKTAGAVGLLRAGITATATAIGGLVSKLSGWGVAAFIAYEVGSLVIEFFGNTTKESKATAAALDKLTESGKGIARTLEDIGTRSPFERLTIDSINARVTAFGELTTAMTETLKAANAEMSKMNWMDSIVDFFKSIAGKDLQSKTAQSFAKSIQSAFAVAVPGDATSDLASSIEKTLGTSIADIEGLQQAYKSMGGATSFEIQQIVINLSKLSQAQQTASARSVELRDSYKEAYKALNTFMISALPSDTLSKIGQNMMADAGKLAEVLKDPTQALVTMKALSSDISALKLFPPEVALQLSTYSEELNKLSYTLTTAEEDLQGLNKTINELQNKKVLVEVGLGGTASNPAAIGIARQGMQEELNRIITELDAAAKTKQIKIDVIADVKTRSKDIEGVFGNALKQQFVEGANILSAKIASEWSKAGTTVSNAVAGLLGDSLTANKLRAENEKQVIRAQIQGIQSQVNLIIATDKLSAQIELSRASEKVRSTQQLLASGIRPGSAADEKAQKDLREQLALEKQLTEKMEARKGLTAATLSGSSGSKAMISQFAAGTGTITREDINFAQMLEASLAQIAVLKANLKVVDITKIVKDLSTNAKLDIESLDRQKTSTQLKLDSFSILEAEGKVLSDTQLTDKKLLEDRMAVFEQLQKILALDEKIAVKKEVQANLVTQTDKDAVQAGIDLLDIDDRRILTGQFLSKLGLGQAKLGYTLETRARSLLAIETETAQIKSTGALESKTSNLDVEKVRLDTLKAIGKVSDDEYATQKARLELSNEDLAHEKTKQDLIKTGQNSERELYKNIDSEQEIRTKTALEAQLLALAAVQERALLDLDTLTEAKKDGINKIAEYEKSRALIDGITDSIVTALAEGGKTGSKKLRQLIVDELKKPVTIIVRAIVDPISKAVSAAGSSMLSSMGTSLAGSAAGKYLASSLGFEGSSFTAMGSAMASNFAGGFNAGLAGTGKAFTSALEVANLETGLAASSGTFGASAGVLAGEGAAMLMAAAPYIAAALVIANAMGVFQTTKTVGSGLMGTLGGPEGIKSYNLDRTSGTLFQGPDYNLQDVKTSELSPAINTAFTVLRKGIAGLVEGLGLSSTAVINFTTTLGKELIHGDNINAYGLKLEGLTPEQQMQKIQAALAITAEDMAKLALGTDKYNKLNEKYSDALTRLSTASTLVTAMFKDLGFSLYETSLEGADNANKLVEALGGVGEAQSKLGFVYDKFYSNEQKRINLSEKATTALKKYNIELPKTREEYLALLKEAAKVGTPDIFAVLTNLAPAINSLLTNVEDNISLLAALADAEGNSSKALEIRRVAELKAMSATDAAIQRRINALNDEKTTYEKLESVLSTAVSGFTTSIDALKSLQASLVSGPDSFTSPEQQLATQKAQLAAQAAIARGPTTNADERAAVAKAAQEVVRIGNDLIKTGNTLFASGPENIALRATISETVGGVAGALELARTNAQEMLDQATVSAGYLEKIVNNTKTNQEFFDAFIAANKLSTELKPAPNVTGTPPPATVDQVLTSAFAQIALQRESNRIQQLQLDVAAEQLRSNAIAIKAASDAEMEAAEERRRSDEYAARNSNNGGQDGGPG